MGRDIPKGWIEVSTEEFKTWLKDGAPNYFREAWGNGTFYRLKSGNIKTDKGSYCANEFAVQSGGRCYVDPSYLKKEYR
jgi:hypothetical protein